MAILTKNLLQLALTTGYSNDHPVILLANIQAILVTDQQVILPANLIIAWG